MLQNFGLVPARARTTKPGQVFGRLTVKAVGKKQGTIRIFAVCQCFCGSAPVAVRADHLHRKQTTSCGCAHRDAITTHGLTGSLHYDRWRHMMSRCYNEADAAYPNYGGRGISVFAEWHDPVAFAEGLPGGYWNGAEMDRIDNDGNYEPGNVKWSTPKQNSHNRRSTPALTFRGETKTQREWSRELGLDERLISSRLVDLGWSVEQALSTPVMDQESVTSRALAARWAGHNTKGRQKPRTERRLLRVEHGGQSLTMAELSEICGVPTKQLRRRIVELGWPLERAIVP